LIWSNRACHKTHCMHVSDSFLCACACKIAQCVYLCVIHTNMNASCGTNQFIDVIYCIETNLQILHIYNQICRFYTFTNESTDFTHLQADLQILHIYKQICRFHTFIYKSTDFTHLHANIQISHIQ
jgi:hypothetical protein